jgi:hypothetical protein
MKHSILRFASTSPLLLALLVSPAGSNPAQKPLWADLDGDGLDELFVLTPGLPDVVLRNLGDGTFADVTYELGLDGCVSLAVVLEDADGDGAIEVLRVTETGSLRLHQQASSGVFLDVTVASGLTAVGGATAARWLDYDRDGRFDLVVESSTSAPRLVMLPSSVGAIARRQWLRTTATTPCTVSPWRASIRIGPAAR